jgi:excisionase family DNA binding protein
MVTNYLKPAEVAEAFQVSTATVISWLKAGKLRGQRTPGGHWRVDPQSVEELGQNMK